MADLKHKANIPNTRQEVKSGLTKEEFEKLHSTCPRCGGTYIDKSNVYETEDKGNYWDDINTAVCRDCSWYGKSIELVAKEEKKDGTIS